MTNVEVAELFADGKFGRSKNMFIDGNTIYSYGYHYPIAKRIGGVYILNTRPTSTTTNKHRYLVRRAVREVIIDVPGCSSDPEVALSYLNDLKKNLIGKIKRARQLKTDRIEEFKKFLDSIQTYNRIFGLNFHASFDDLDLLTRIEIL
jgi:hypothetical protein